MGNKRRSRSRSRARSKRRYHSKAGGHDLDRRLSRIEAFLERLEPPDTRRSASSRENISRSRSPQHRGKSSPTESQHRGESPHGSSLQQRAQSPRESRSQKRGRSPHRGKPPHRGRSPEEFPSQYQGKSPHRAESQHRSESPLAPVITEDPLDRSESPGIILSVSEDDLPESFLQAVGVDSQSKSNEAQTIPPGLLSSWIEQLQSGLPKEDREKILALYRPVDSNCFNAPGLNIEVANLLNSTIKSKDFRMYGAQHCLISALTAHACALKAIANFSSIPQNEKEALGTILADSSKLLCSVFHSLTFARREALYPFLSTSFKDAAHKTPATNLLFGENISERISKQKSLESVSKVIKAPVANPRAVQAKTFQTLNRRGPIRPRGGVRSQGRNPSDPVPKPAYHRDPKDTKKEPVYQRYRRN